MRVVVTFVLLFFIHHHVVGQEVDWIKVKKFVGDLQGAVAKEDVGKARYAAIGILRELPNLEDTYYLGLSVGGSTRIVAGKAKEVIGNQAGAKLNFLTRAPGEYLGLDSDVRGLCVIYTGGKRLNNLLEIGYEYRMHPSGHHPVYSMQNYQDALKNLTQIGMGDFISKNAHSYHDYLKKGCVVIDTKDVDVASLSKRMEIKVVFADVRTRVLGAGEYEYLAVKAVYRVQRSKWELLEGDLSRCEDCAPKDKSFLVVTAPRKEL